jgi:hypothetical protein
LGQGRFRLVLVTAGATSRLGVLLGASQVEFGRIRLVRVFRVGPAGEIKPQFWPIGADIAARRSAGGASALINPGPVALARRRARCPAGLPA